MVSFEIDPDTVPNLKLGIHSFQIIFSFVSWCLQIVVLANKNSAINGNLGWTFAVCFISIPAWVFLIMTPRWQRSRRFANPSAMLCVDVLFTILWLSAFSTLAKFNSDNNCGDACGVSKGAVALDVLVTLFFGASTALSIFTLKHYQYNGTLPGYEKRRIGGPGGANTTNNNDPDKTAFSMAPDGDEPYSRIDMDDPDHNDDRFGSDLAVPRRSREDFGYTGAGSALSNDGPISGGYGGSYNSHTSMHFDSPNFESPRPDEPGYNSRVGSPAVGGYGRETAEDSPYDSHVARFPNANYNA